MIMYFYNHLEKAGVSSIQRALLSEGILDCPSLRASPSAPFPRREDG